MFADKDSLTSCKIIDCGMMIQLPPNEKVYTSTKIQGTMGYVAPESLSKKQYSSASDIWQAGICLYSLLSGSYPFNPRYPEHVIERGYVPMNGLGWKNISDNAKNLVDKMLIKNPQDRITISQILQHPCKFFFSNIYYFYYIMIKLLIIKFIGLQINGATSEALGPAYNARLKQLLLRQKLKEFFVDSDLETTITTQRENLLEVAPILRKFSRQRKPKVSIAESPNTRPRRPSLKILPVDGENDQPTISTPTTTTTRSTFSPSRPPLPRPNLISTPSTAPRFPMLSTPTSRFGKSSSSGGSGSGSGSNSYEKMREFNIKLNQLKSVVISWVHKVKSTVQTSLNSSSSSSNNSNYIDNFNSSLNYESFERILLDCGLDEIAKPEVFSIFDIEKTGQIRLRDVLLTLQAFKPLNDVYDEDGRLDSARFYFRLFDIDESGTIDINDLKIVISCLVLNDLPILSSLSAPPSPPTSSNSVNYVPNKSCVNELPDDLTARSVNDLFSLINISSDGRIDFDEFRIFYDAILAYSNTRQTVVSYETEATKKIDQIILEDQFRCFGFDF